MKELHARAQSPVTASVEECLALLRAIEDYPRWYPDGVKSASVIDRGDDGVPTKIRTTLHVATGPFVKDFTLTMGVAAPNPTTLTLARIPHGPGDHERFGVTWTVAPNRLAIAFDAQLSVPRFLPTGGVGESIAGGFVNAAARALRAQ